MFDTFAVESFEDFVGQNELKERLAIHIESANKRQATMEHVLLDGPPGSGKTMISSLIADSLCVDFAEFIMPIKPQALKRIAQTHFGVVLFDEIHRCSVKQQEELLTVIQGNYLQTDMGQIIECPDLCVIGATTEPDQIIAPLYDRFQIKPKFEDYTDEEMALIAAGMSGKVGLELSPRQLRQIGKASGGLPRNAKSLVIMARDLQAVKGRVKIKEVLERCNVTESGLTAYHLEYLGTLSKSSPAGIEIIAAQMRLPRSVILDLERLLVKRNLIQYTKQGRDILSGGYKALKAK